MIERAQWRKEMGNRKEKLGISKLVRKKAENTDRQHVSNIDIYTLLMLNG